MRTKLFAIILAVCLILLATCAYAQVVKWDTLRYEKWGFSVQIPSGGVKQTISNQPPGGMIDVYSFRGMAFVVAVTPIAGNQISSTVVEQTIQSEVKKAERLGDVKRWEQDSKQGDLFKGFTGSVKLKSEDPVEAIISKIIGSNLGIECISMAPLGDDTTPILHIGVIGPKNRWMESAAFAKGMVAFVTKTSAVSPSIKTAPRKLIPESGPAVVPKLKPNALVKPWPMLRKGEIELTGVVESVSADGRSLTLTVNVIKLPGQEQITLNPARSKKVLLKKKLSWLVAGQCIHLVGKNAGIGKPIRADAIKLSPVTRPTRRSLPISPGLTA